ncbi:hypothetical protein AB0442_16730 [Kitasatospora sp. NPDC085895]|uniref:hypothetical protein n=1 Tax=Kitasatospora sp. NPDC085895 TaxID=3155057 RepID=UPI00344CB46E
MWREAGSDTWQCGPVAFGPGESDGAGWLFELLVDGSAEAVRRDAEDHYGRAVDPQAVAAVLAGVPLDRRTGRAVADG